MNNRLMPEDNTMKEHEFDLPLSSNFHNVRVEHFVLDLSCSLKSKVFDCSMTLFCKMSSSINVENGQDNAAYCHDNSKRQALVTPEQIKINEHDEISQLLLVCLDCFALDVSACNLCQWTSVTSDLEVFTHTSHQVSHDTPLKIPHKLMHSYYEIYASLQGSRHESVPLEYQVKEHCLNIFLPPNVNTRYPVILKISFRTQMDGPSLMWTVDQCGRPCVFTIGHLLNNRSLFPCQDLPQALSTWHCAVTLMDLHTEQESVVMTGETEPKISFNNGGQKVFSFCNSYPMPAATFALAIGTWSVTEIIHPSNVTGLDFDSPHLMFLSQSLLSPDLSMCYRLSHELCHTWFGILTGPRDWTEEWLTEGICCYLEDIIHAAVMKWDEDESRNRSVLRALLKFRILMSEVSHTPEELQTLRPNFGRVTSLIKGNDPQMFVRNGLNHEKTVMQVHYLKGFFLLRYLEDIAGSEVFLKALRSFTSLHLGQLFSSKELLDYIFENCCNLSGSGLTVAQVCQDWLDCPGIPYHLNNFPTTIECSLVTEVQKEVYAIKATVSRKRVRGQSSKNADCAMIRSVKLSPEQLVLMMEMLVEEKVAVTAGQLQTLRDTYNIEEANAEVKHSWCELVIYRRAVQWIKDVEDFLLHHQALGVYLYGELLITKNKRFQNLAYDCYNKLQTNMAEGPKTLVRDMLFPS